MKKHLFLAIALLASCVSMSAQETWFPTKVGTKMTYADLDAKGKVTSLFDYTVTDVTTDGGKTTILFNIDAKDDKGTSAGLVLPGKVWTADGYFHADAKASLRGLVNVDDVTVKGHAPILPENPAAGNSIEDCHVSIEALMAEVNWSNITFTKGVSVTTAAGTFDDAVLLEYDIQVKIAFVKVNSHGKEWYVKGIGAVRTESYNKGKLASARELQSIEK